MNKKTTQQHNKKGKEMVSTFHRTTVKIIQEAGKTTIGITGPPGSVEKITIYLVVGGVVLGVTLVSLSYLKLQRLRVKHKQEKQETE